ncbi:hypothetical protein AHAS_Ahas12G0083800 [Arachis hypogaea]
MLEGRRCHQERQEGKSATLRENQPKRGRGVNFATTSLPREAAVAIVVLIATYHRHWSQPPSSPFMPSLFLATTELRSSCAPLRSAVPY